MDRLDLLVHHLRPLVCPEQVRDARAVDVGVHQADLRAGAGERRGEENGDGTLSHAPLARADGNHALDRQPLVGGHFRRPVVRGNGDLDGRLGELSPQQLLQSCTHIVPNWSRPRGQPKRYGNPLAGDFDALDLVELGDASPGFGVWEFGQCGPDCGFRDRHDCPCGGGANSVALRVRDSPGKATGREKREPRINADERGKRGLTRRRGGRGERGVGREMDERDWAFPPCSIW